MSHEGDPSNGNSVSRSVGSVGKVPVVHDAERGAYRVDVDHDRSGVVSTAILLAIATIEDADPAALPTLADAIDPDALDVLFGRPTASDDSGLDHVTFTFAGYRITVEASGTIEIEPVDSDDL